MEALVAATWMLHACRATAQRERALWSNGKSYEADTKELGFVPALQGQKPALDQAAQGLD